MKLAIQPESYEKLHLRFPGCLQKIWNPELIAAGKDRPGIHRENVFDTDDGFRLIISLDGHEDQTVLHISCSIYDPEPWRGVITNDADFLAQTLAAFKRISKRDETGVAITKVKNSVCHMIYPLDLVPQTATDGLSRRFKYED